MNRISIVVPCYNEAASLPMFYKKTQGVLRAMGNCDYEFVLVDDGSKDETLEVIKELNAADEHVVFLSFSRNFGKEAAMYAGLEAATGDYCVIMDADLQHPPELLPEMYQAVTEEGYDCCGGMRTGREGDGMLRSLFSRVFYRVGKHLTNLDMSDGKGDFRMMRREVVKAILDMKEYNRYMKGLFSFVGFTTKWIEFQNIERQQGESKWSLKSLFKYAAEGIMSFSTAPLKFSGAAGGMLFLAGIAYLAVKCILAVETGQKFESTDVILMAVLFISSMQMFFLYILGAYLSKDYLENKKRPLYIVREKSK